MYFRILGSVRVDVEPSPLHQSTSNACDGYQPLRLSGRRKQTILAMLVVDLGRLVSTERLIDAVWSDLAPPVTARAQVQNCAAALRRALLAHGHDRLSADHQATVVTEPHGYRLDADSEAVDAFQFAEIVRDSLDAPRDRDHEVISALRRGLDMWTGTALAGLPSLELQAEAARLDELKLLAVEELVSRELRVSGKPAVSAADLRALSKRNPYRERLWLLLMEALRRCGRATEALAAFREFRAKLVADHGIEPGPKIRAKEKEILQQHC